MGRTTIDATTVRRHFGHTCVLRCVGVTVGVAILGPLPHHCLPYRRETEGVRRLQSKVEFLRATGWRRDEARLLTWAAVDMEGGTIRLEDARAKSGNPRVFPFGLAPSLKTSLQKRWAERDGLYVFHREGKPLGVGAVRSAWKRACKRAGLVGRLLHDLRRSAARDFRRAGVSEGEIMRLCGWETRSMFDRYNIIDEADLASAVAKRFNGKVTAKSEGFAEQAS